MKQKFLLLCSLDKADEVPLYAMKANGGNKRRAPFILNRCTRQRLLLQRPSDSPVLHVLKTWRLKYV